MTLCRVVVEARFDPRRILKVLSQCVFWSDKGVEARFDPRRILKVGISDSMRFR